MLGSLTALGEVVTYESMKDAVLSSIPKGTEELNIAAFDKGYEYAMDLKAHDDKTRKPRVRDRGTNPGRNISS